MNLASWSGRDCARGEISMNYTHKCSSIIDNSKVRCVILSQIRTMQLGIQRSLQQLYASVGSWTRLDLTVSFLKKQIIKYLLIIWLFFFFLSFFSFLLFKRLTLKCFKIWVRNKKKRWKRCGDLMNLLTFITL